MAAPLLQEVQQLLHLAALGRTFQAAVTAVTAVLLDHLVDLTGQ
jgi:hypothetical protein